jgi:hypothetical protein
MLVNAVKSRGRQEKGRLCLSAKAAQDNDLGARGRMGLHAREGRSDAVVELELERMGRHLEFMHFLPPHIEIGLDEVVGEDVALLEEGVVLLQALERFAQ